MPFGAEEEAAAEEEEAREEEEQPRRAAKEEQPDKGEKKEEKKKEKTEERGSLLQLKDGTPAMVRCMRKGHGALECPVCLQLFNKPVMPTNSECRCTFCESCFQNLVKFGGRCTKCARRLPVDAAQCQINEEVKRAIEAFQQQGGEDAQFATMMTGLKGQNQPKYQMLNMNEFRLDPKPLASGAYGQVFKGTWVKQNLAVAVKKVLRTSVMTHQQTMESFRKEIDILSMLDHPHVLKLFGAVVDDDNICIVTELVPGGSLFDLIHTKPLLKPEAVIVIGTGVCKGMTYLHSMGIIHRDLKPGNLLMGAVASPSGPQLVVKVADFGLARVQDTARTMTGGIGTSQYTAPEVLRSERYDTKADVFSFGVILWEIHARKIPYSEMNQMQIAVAVATQDHRPPPPKHCPAPFWQLMQHCWSTKPPNRPSFPEVLSQLEDMQFVFNLAASAHGSMSRSGASQQSRAQQQEAQAAQRAAAAQKAAQQRQLDEQQRRLQQLNLQQQQQPSPSPPPRAQGSPVQQSSHSQSKMDIGSSDGRSGATTLPAGDGPLISSPPDVVKSERRVLKVPSHFATIGAALAAARNDDQIVLEPGRYQEALEIRDKVVEIVGNGNMQHLLIESIEGRPALELDGAVLRLSNLMVVSSAPRAIAVLGGRLVMEDCNVSGGQQGLRVSRRAEATVRRSVLCRCAQQGLYVEEGSSALVESCSIFENGDHGIVVVSAGASLTISRSMVSYNGGAGICIDQGAGGAVESNDLRNNNLGPCTVGALSQANVTVSSNLTT